MGRKRREEAGHEDARQAVRVLKQGGVLLHATDTVWGLACDATNDEAVQRMNTIKERHPVHPVLVLVADEGHVEQLVGDVPEAAWDLMELETVPPPWSTPRQGRLFCFARRRREPRSALHSRRLQRIRHSRIEQAPRFDQRHSQDNPHPSRSMTFPTTSRTSSTTSASTAGMT